MTVGSESAKAVSCFREVSKQRVAKISNKQIRNLDLQKFAITKRSQGKSQPSKAILDDISMEEEECELDLEELNDELNSSQALNFEKKVDFTIKLQVDKEDLPEEQIETMILKNKSRIKKCPF
jgi:ABC-type phosphate transport system auxiliary subunit